MISVIIPVYNGEKTVMECLESVSGQTYKDIEIILVDNNSVDGSAQILKDFCLKDSRAFYYNCPDRGVGFARNFGLGKALGEYVIFLDCDDRLFEYALERMYRQTQKYQADVLLGNVLMRRNGKDVLQDSNGYGAVLHGGEIPQFFYDKLPTYICFNPTKLFRRSLLTEHNILFSTSVSLGEDVLFVMEVFGLSKCICYLSEPFHIYNIGSDGLNLKYRRDLDGIKTFLRNSMREYLISAGMEGRLPESIIYNDMFSLIRNEIKAGKKVYSHLTETETYAELMNGKGVSGGNPVYLFMYVCLKFKCLFFLVVLAKLWQ